MRVAHGLFRVIPHILICLIPGGSPTMATQQPGSVQTQSIWAATAKLPTYPALDKDTRAEVCIVGAGIAGLTTAYLLTQAGKAVVILDDGPLAGGMTQVTTAHL